MSTQPVRQEFAFTKTRLCFTRNSESKSWAKIAAACPKLGYRRLNRVCERGIYAACLFWAPGWRSKGKGKIGPGYKNRKLDLHHSGGGEIEYNLPSANGLRKSELGLLTGDF
jgi:hypothetical protein